MKISKMTNLCVAFALSTAISSAASAQSSAYSIRAGRSIGLVHVGVEGGFDLKRLPKPDAEDNYTSHSVKVWVSKRAGRADTLFIKTVNNGALGIEPNNGVSVEVIRVTSPRYHTLNRLSTGSTFAQVRRTFPDVAAVDDKQSIYDDRRHGIAFEFANSPSGDSPCTAVMVHPPGKRYVASAEEVQNLLNEGHRP